MALVWSGSQDYVPTVTSFSRHEENITHLFDIILAVELVLINIKSYVLHTWLQESYALCKTKKQVLSITVHDYLSVRFINVYLGGKHQLQKRKFNSLQPKLYGRGNN